MERSRVLIVDDEELIGRALIRLLRPECDVEAVNSVDLALEALDDDAPDLLLCDIKMPDQGGIELYRMIAERDPALAARIVFMTGDLCCERTRQFLDEVPNARIEKPMDPERLVEMLRRVAAA